jgi:hypothetical protein
MTRFMLQRLVGIDIDHARHIVNLARLEAEALPIVEPGT